ncbi:GTP-binding protein [Lyngbya aestuarii]|uniref:GTP-binding protein n=1 Tax=Lyngbya aestuarii TaxID=118322 RepID=UPI00403D8583
MDYISKKICLVGDFGVGKTSLIRRFVERQFSDQYLSTVGVKISRKTIELLGEESQKMQKLQVIIWDLEGHTKFKAIAPSYLQGASGAIVVADVTRPETIEHIAERVNLFLAVNPKSPVIIALNKTDLVTQEEISTISQFDQIHQIIGTYQTSAKTGLHVDKIFQKLADKMLKKAH